MTFTYPNTTTPIFENVTFDVTMGDRIALLGPNGIGKSTFLSVLNNTLEPQVVGAGRGGDCQGEIYRHHNLVIGYFAQHHIDALESTLSPLQHMMKIAPQSSEQELRGLLGSFGITGQLAIQVGLRSSPSARSLEARSRVWCSRRCHTTDRTSCCWMSRQTILTWTRWRRW